MTLSLLLFLPNKVSTKLGAHQFQWQRFAGRRVLVRRHILIGVRIKSIDYRFLTHKFGGMLPSEVKKLRALEEENRQLKRLVADLSLDKAMLQDVIKRKL